MFFLSASLPRVARRREGHQQLLPSTRAGRRREARSGFGHPCLGPDRGAYAEHGGPESPFSRHSLATNIARWRLDKRAPSSPYREDPWGDIHAGDDRTYQCVHARQAPGRVGDVCRALLPRRRVVVPLQPASVQRGTLQYLSQNIIRANALAS